MATDKRLDQVSTLTDFDYALIVKGDQEAKVSKKQLAELVGNLLYGATNASSRATVVAGNMTSVKNDWDANNLVINGSYYITGGENIPEPYFYIVVLRAASSPDFVQYGIGVSSSTMYLRIFANNEWSSWTRIG